MSRSHHKKFKNIKALSAEEIKNIWFKEKNSVSNLNSSPLLVRGSTFPLSYWFVVLIQMRPQSLTLYIPYQNLIQAEIQSEKRKFLIKRIDSTNCSYYFSALWRHSCCDHEFSDNNLITKVNILCSVNSFYSSAKVCNVTSTTINSFLIDK